MIPWTRASYHILGPKKSRLELGKHRIQQLAPLDVRYGVAITSLRAAGHVGELGVGEERWLGDALVELASLVVRRKEYGVKGGPRAQAQERWPVLRVAEVDRERADRCRARVSEAPPSQSGTLRGSTASCASSAEISGLQIMRR